MIHPPRTLSLLLVLPLTAGCASLGSSKPENRSEKVTAEGWAPVNAADMEESRRRSLADAQKKAVEKVAGVFLAASTRVEAAVTLHQKVLADVKGHIKRYTILNERVEDGFHKTLIQAIVARPAKEGAQAGSAGLPASPPPESPAVIVEVLKAGSENWGRFASAAIRKKLSEHGFRTLESGSNPDRTKHLLVRGDASVVAVQDRRLGSFRSYHAAINVEAVEFESGAVIWSQSGEGSALGLDEDSARSRALEKAGDAVGRSAAADLSAYLWRRF